MCKMRKVKKQTSCRKKTDGSGWCFSLGGAQCIGRIIVLFFFGFWCFWFWGWTFWLAKLVGKGYQNCVFFADFVAGLFVGCLSLFIGNFSL